MSKRQNSDQFLLHEIVTPGVQLRTLRAILSRVSAEVAAGRVPIVEIDLDLCGVMPQFRTKEALRKVGLEFDVPEFLDPSALPILPGYSDEAWGEFIDRMELESRWPNLTWKENGRPVRRPGTIFGRFHDLYWTNEWLHQDSPTPGLGAFVHRVESAGGKVVFISGRWLDHQIPPTVRSLQRAGIVQPNLVIGNPWHETLRPPDGRILSDSEIKAHRQTEIRTKHGTPVAIIDDRAANREAVVKANESEVLSVAIAIPGFTCDMAVAGEPLRLSTFETFDFTLGEEPKRPYMLARYAKAGLGKPWRGLYEGLGRNQLPYVLPRMADQDEDFGGVPRPFASIVRSHQSGTLPEEALVELCIQTIPPPEIARMETALREAKELAVEGLAAPFPVSPQFERHVWLCLVTSWLHSRDIEYLMGALGYSINATGVHDIEETVPGSEIIKAIQSNQAKGQTYGDWLLRWIARTSPSEMINVGFLNPALLVSTSQWTPTALVQDAMDVHRVSSHHNGDLNERYDPLEAAVNNLLHQREGRFGIRKEPVESWQQIFEGMATESGAEELAKNSAARNALHDALVLAREMEGAGILTPWGLVVAETSSS